MRRVIGFLLLIISVNTLYAQFPTERNRTLLDISYSKWQGAESFYLGIEHTFFNDISIGVKAVRMVYDIPLQGSWSFKREMYYSEFFANYYFNHLLQLPKSVMLYSGVDILLMPRPYSIHPGIQSGIRYCVGKKLCVGAEYLIGQHFQRLSVGLQIKI